MFKELYSGPVHRADVLVTFSEQEAAEDFGLSGTMMDKLKETSSYRQRQNLPYLTWVATPAIFGALDTVRQALNFSTQTHPHYHEGMDSQEFQELVTIYMTELSACWGIGQLHLNFRGEHTLVVVQVDPNDTGRTTP